MKKITLIIFLTIGVFATDYSGMSITEMQSLKGSIPEADRANFRTQMQSKMQDLSSQERENIKSNMRKSQPGSMNGTGSHMRKGGINRNSASGKMYRGGH